MKNIIIRNFDFLRILKKDPNLVEFPTFQNMIGNWRQILLFTNLLWMFSHFLGNLICDIFWIWYILWFSRVVCRVFRCLFWNISTLTFFNIWLLGVWWLINRDILGTLPITIIVIKPKEFVVWGWGNTVSGASIYQLLKVIVNFWT